MNKIVIGILVLGLLSGFFYYRITIGNYDDLISDKNKRIAELSEVEVLQDSTYQVLVAQKDEITARNKLLEDRITELNGRVAYYQSLTLTGQDTTAIEGTIDTVYTAEAAIRDYSYTIESEVITSGGIIKSKTPPLKIVEEWRQLHNINIQLTFAETDDKELNLSFIEITPEWIRLNKDDLVIEYSPYQREWYEKLFIMPALGASLNGTISTTLGIGYDNIVFSYGYVSDESGSQSYISLGYIWFPFWRKR